MQATKGEAVASKRLAVLCRQAATEPSQPRSLQPQATASTPALGGPLQTSYDYIIVGAGSAGCVAASRLSEDPRVSVLLIEAGGSNQQFRVRSPLLTYQNLQNSDLDWAYRTTRQAAADDRTFHWPRGKCLGGCSSINAMLYVRGDPRNFDHWARQGCSGWGYEEVLPFFMRSEKLLLGDGKEGRGRDGPLTVTDMSKYDFVNKEVCEQFVQSCEAVGLPRSDYNGREQRGAHFAQVTVKDGVRCDVYSAFLVATGALARPNLTVLTNAMVNQVVIRGAQATGVSIQRGKAEPPILVNANREVVLCCGAVGTPQLLLLSGIGPKSHLAEHGIHCVKELPVGENLQDHLFIPLGHSFKPGLRSAFAPKRPLTGGAVSGLGRHLLFGTGVMSYPMIQCMAFEHSGLPGFDKEEGNDLQVHYLGFVGALNAQQIEANFGIVGKEGRPGLDELAPKEGVTLVPTILLPKSRGTVRLASADAQDHPIIEPGYFSDERDLDLAVAAVKLVRSIAKAPPLGDVLAGEFVDPSIPHDVASDDYVRELVRRYAVTVYHPVGTAKMGAEDDATAVVDPCLRVKGIKGLRVADASVMPVVTSGNTNAPCIMIGERVADFIQQGSP